MKINISIPQYDPGSENPITHKIYLALFLFIHYTLKVNKTDKGEYHNVHLTDKSSNFQTELNLFGLNLLR